MAVPPRKIFISYRRSDHPEFVERVRDWFIHIYGRDNVFMDFDSIPLMVKFADYIRGEVEKCDVMLAIIGPHWLELLREKTANFEEDYVRIEVSLALQLSKLVAPVCIMDAHMPKKSELPDDIRPLLDYNAAFLSRRDFYDNIERILEAVENQLNVLDEQKAHQYFDNGKAKADQNDYDGAILDYSSAISLKPNFKNAYEQRAYAHISKGDIEEAIQDYTEVFLLDQDNIGSFVFLNALRRMREDYEGIIAESTRVIKRNPQFPFAFSMRADALYKQGDTEGAINDYTEAIRLANEPSNVSNYEARGCIYYSEGDMEGAISDYTEAIRLAPKHVDAYEGRAEAYFASGQYELALSDFEQAHEIAPDDNKIVAGLAVALWKMWHREQAAHYWQALVEEDERYFDAEWVGKEFNWAKPLIEVAGRLTEVIDLL